jgi:hypothetical protein
MMVPPSGAHDWSRSGFGAGRIGRGGGHPRMSWHHQDWQQRRGHGGGRGGWEEHIPNRSEHSHHPQIPENPEPWEEVLVDQSKRSEGIENPGQVVLEVEAVADCDVQGGNLRDKGKDVEVGGSFAQNLMDKGEEGQCSKVAAPVQHLGAMAENRKALGIVFKEGGSSSEVRPKKYGDNMFCHRCKVSTYFTKDCRSGWYGERKGNPSQEGVRNGSKQLCEMIAPLCATQVEGDAFFVL